MRQPRTLAQAPRPVRAEGLPYRRRLTLHVVALLNLRDVANYRVNLFQAIPSRTVA